MLALGMDDVHGPADVMNGIPLKVATPLSSVNRFCTHEKARSIYEKQVRVSNDHICSRLDTQPLIDTTNAETISKFTAIAHDLLIHFRSNIKDMRMAESPNQFKYLTKLLMNNSHSSISIEHFYNFLS